MKIKKKIENKIKYREEFDWLFTVLLKSKFIHICYEVFLILLFK